MRAALVSSHHGRVVGDHEIGETLAAQLTAPVRWASCIAPLVGQGVTHAITVGPGRVLRGLLRKNAPGVLVLGTESAADLEHTIEVLA